MAPAERRVGEEVGASADVLKGLVSQKVPMELDPESLKWLKLESDVIKCML